MARRKLLIVEEESTIRNLIYALGRLVSRDREQAFALDQVRDVVFIDLARDNQNAPYLVYELWSKLRTLRDFSPASPQDDGQLAAAAKLRGG